jgi:hypothetical protein
MWLVRVAQGSAPAHPAQLIRVELDDLQTVSRPDFKKGIVSLDRQKWVQR